MADAMMMFLGEAHGVKWYWAQPGEFENPGVYYWDGAKNVLCVPHLAAAPEAPAQANDWTPLTPEEQDRLDGLLKHARWLAESMPTMEGLQHSWALNARQVMARMHDWLNRYLPPATPCVPKKPCAVDERDRKDAERYRWLREQHWTENLIGVVIRPKDNARLGSMLPSLELLDDTIDHMKARAALAQKGAA